MRSFEDEEALQLEIEFWHTVDELHDNAMAQCWFSPRATTRLHNAAEWYKRCEWCKSKTGMGEELSLALDFTDPNQQSFDLDL